jgi:hypothetical protein
MQEDARQTEPAQVVMGTENGEGGGGAAPPAVKAQASGEAADVQAPTVGSGSAARGEPLERPGENVTCEDIGDEDGALDDDEEGALDKAEASNSVMQMYARKILARLRDELSHQSATDDWLLRILQNNGWWLRAKNARDVMANLSAGSDPALWAEPFYHRDIFVWLPDMRWGEMPTCPTCGSNHDVHVHDYRLHKPTRRFAC